MTSVPLAVGAGRTGFWVGDTVGLAHERDQDRPHDGTVVDYVRGDDADLAAEPLVRVYWRNPPGEVRNYHPADLVRRV